MTKHAMRFALMSSLAVAGIVAGTLSFTPSTQSKLAHAGTLACTDVVGPQNLTSSCATWYQRWMIAVLDCDAQSVTAEIKNGLGATIDTVPLTLSVADYWWGMTSCLGPDAKSITVTATGGDIAEGTLSVGSTYCGCSPE